MTNTTGADASAVVRGFLRAFFSGDLEAARAMVRDDFTFTAPLVLEAGSKEMFFAGAEAKTRFIEDVHVVRQLQEGNDVATIYRIDVRTPGGDAAMLLHEWHTVVDGRLASSVMIFDTKAPAAQLLHDALMTA